jgi:hypothetical protein
MSYRVSRSSGFFGPSEDRNDRRPIEKRIWDLLHDNKINGVQLWAELVPLLERLPDRKLDLSQQEPLSSGAMFALFRVLTSGKTDRQSEALLDQLILGQINDFDGLRDWRELRVTTLDLSRLRVYGADSYLPLTPWQVRRLQDQAKSRASVNAALQTVVVDRSSTLEGQATRWEDPRNRVKIECVDLRSLTVEQRADMLKSAFSDLLLDADATQDYVDEVLDDGGFSAYCNLNLDDMGHSSWPGLKTLLASPHCPVRTLVLPPPDNGTMVKAFGLEDETLSYRVSKYLQSVFGSPDQESSGPVRLETVRLTGWSLVALQALRDTQDLKDFPVKRFLIPEPKYFVDLLNLGALQDPLFLERPQRTPDQLERYSNNCWRELISMRLALPRHPEEWPEFSSTCLNFDESCSMATWGWLAEVLKWEGCHFHTLVFAEVEVQGDASRELRLRNEFLSTYVSSGLRLDLSRWWTKMSAMRGDDWYLDGVGFGPGDIEHLLSLPLTQATVIVLSEECIEKNKSQLEALVRKGWAIEDRQGRRLTSPTPVASTEGTLGGAAADGGPTVSSAEVLDDSARLFEARKATIKDLIIGGRSATLKTFLSTWLYAMSVVQLKDLQKMAGEHSDSETEDVRDAARALDEAVTKRLPVPTPVDRTEAATTSTPHVSEGSGSVGNEGVQVSAVPVASGLSSETFASRKDSIRSLVAGGLKLALEKAMTLPDWLDLQQLSVNQLNELKTLADQHVVSNNTNVQAAATVLKTALEKARQPAK